MIIKPQFANTTLELSIEKNTRSLDYFTYTCTYPWNVFFAYSSTRREAKLMRNTVAMVEFRVCANVQKNQTPWDLISVARYVCEHIIFIYTHTWYHVYFTFAQTTRSMHYMRNSALMDLKYLTGFRTTSLCILPTFSRELRRLDNSYRVAFLTHAIHRCVVFVIAFYFCTTNIIYSIN